MAFGALIIKETLVLSDEELVNQMTENPYFQYFIGLPEFQKEAPFDPSMMVHFRKRLNGQVMQIIFIRQKPKNIMKALRKAVDKQLRYVARDIRIVKDLLNMEGHGTLSQKQEREFQTI